MESDSSFGDQPSIVNSSIGLNVSFPQINYSKIQQVINMIGNQEQIQKGHKQGTKNQVMISFREQQNDQDSFHSQIHDQSSIQSNISYINDSRIQPDHKPQQEKKQVLKFESNNDFVQYPNSPLDRTINNDDIDVINKSDELLNESHEIFKPMKHTLIVKEKKLMSQDVDMNVQKYTQAFKLNQSMQIQPQTFFKDFSIIETKNYIDNSISQAFIKKELIDQIKINDVSDRQSSNFTVSDRTINESEFNNIQTLISQNSNVTSTLYENSTNYTDTNNSQLNNINEITISSSQNQYDDGNLHQLANIWSRDVMKQKLQVFEKRNEIKKKKQSILTKVNNSEKKQLQKLKLQNSQKQKYRKKNLPQIKQQNINVLNQMFNHNQNLIKKNFKGLSTRFYNVFYIDETTKFHNRYILGNFYFYFLDLSINFSAKNIERQKQRQNQQQKLQKKKKQENLSINEKQKLGRKQTEIALIHKKKSQQNSTDIIIDQQRRKYVEERNRKKAQKKLQLKMFKQEKFKKNYGFKLQQVGFFRIDMKLLTSVVWEHVVFLVMKKSQIDDKTFKLFFDSANKFPDLMRIDFSENNITDQGFIYFVENSHKFEKLFDIFFNQNKLTNRGLEALSQEKMNFQFYKRIHLSENLIDDDGYESFFSKGCNYPNLLQIQFDGNPKVHKPLMTCKSLQKFALNIGFGFFKHLKQVHFLNNFIKDEGLMKFADKINQLQELTDINFGINKITSKGFGYFLEKINQLDQHHFIRKVHFSKFFIKKDKNLIQKIPKNEIKKLILNPYATLIFMNLKQNPLMQDQNSCFFLANIFFNMKLKFKLQVFLNAPYTLNLQNMGFDFKRAIQIINGSDSGVVKLLNEESTRNQTILQEFQQNNNTTKNQNQIRFQRLTSLNLSNLKLNIHDWDLFVKNIDSLPELEDLNLGKNNIELIQFQQLKHLQEIVSKRNKKSSKILKVTLTNNKNLKEQSIIAIDRFIQETENRCVFIILTLQNLQQNYQKLQKNNIVNELQKYEEKYFEIQILSSLQFGLKQLSVNKNIKDSRYQFRFKRMLQEIIGNCKNQIQSYQKVKLMFQNIYEDIKSSRQYSTKKDQINKVWKIIQDFCFDLIGKWCKNIQNNYFKFQFNQNQIKCLLSQLSDIKLPKKVAKNKQK